MTDKKGPVLNLTHSKKNPKEQAPKETEDGELPEELFQAVASEEYKRIMDRFDNLDKRIDSLFVLFGAKKGE